MADDVQYELSSTQFSDKEQRSIAKMVCESAKHGRDALAEWKKRKAKSLEMAFNRPPSEIEDLSKEDWMSDRNIGICGATCDSLRSILYATCYNPDSIHAQPVEENDIDRSEMVEKFIKTVVQDPRNDVATETMDFATNVVQTGIGYLKTFWCVEEKWVDKRIWTKKEGTKKSSLKVVTEKQRFEYGKIVNIADVDDIICPDYGKSIDDVPYVIEVLHLTGADIDRMAKKGTFVNVDDNFRLACVGKVADRGHDSQREVKSEEQGICDDSSELEFKQKEIDILEAYFCYEKNGMEEEYRFYIHEATQTFLGGKPLRKILPSGRRPYASCPLDKIAGKLRGRSMPELIWDPCNQMNTIFNQKTDFQFVVNCPTGFYDVNDPNIKGAQELTPGKLYPTNSPNSVHFPSRTMSDAWAYNDLQFLMQMIERISGAASYFLTSESKQGTATRDAIVAQKSDTRISIWVRAMLTAISNILNKNLELYQAWAPKELGARLIGKDGEKLFDNFSAEQIQGYYDVRISPDIVSGSKAYQSQLALQRFNLMMANPLVQQYLPGLWQLTYDTLKETGTEFPDKYLPQQPKDESKIDDEIENEFLRFVQGEEIKPPEGASPEAIKHLQGHMQQYEKIHLIPEEHRQKFDDHIFMTQKNIAQFQQDMLHEALANQLALGGMGGRGIEGEVTGVGEQQGLGALQLPSGGAGEGLSGLGSAEGVMSGQVAGGTPISEDSASAGTVM